MGNSSSTSISTSSSETYNLNDINNLKENLGNCDNLEIEDSLDSLSDSNINHTEKCQESINTFFYLESEDTSNNEQVESTVTPETTESTENTETRVEEEKSNNSNYLNNFLGEVNEYIESNFLSNKDNEDISVIKNINGIRLLKYEEILLKGDNSEEIELGNKYSLSSELGNIYNIMCVYEMPENTIGYYNRNVISNLEDCYLGYSSNNNRFNVYNPNGELEIRRTFRLNWLVYENENSVDILLNNIEGVVIKDDEIIENDINYFVNLEEAYNSLKNNDVRLMNSYVNKFKNVSSNLLNDKNIIAIIGGDRDGDLLSLRDFLEKLEL